MAVLFWTVSILLGVAVLAVAQQQYRYLRTRREIVVDRQQLFHSSSAFHVCTVLALAPGQELLSGVRGFVESIERSGAKVVYAGKIAVNAMQSSQLPRADWDAFVLSEYPSREAYAVSEASPEFQKVRSSFATAYSLGMKRSPLVNLLLPVFLLVRRSADVLKRRPARVPFRPVEVADSFPTEQLAKRDQLVKGLLANRDYGKDACVVLNFMKNGSKEQRDANSGYGSEMMGLMAEMRMGPTHMGRAVTLEGDASFDQIAIVYYPGVEFFADMVQSDFFGGIVGGKQLGDTLSSPTVPLLPHL